MIQSVCQLHPLPTVLVKGSHTSLAPIIITIIQSSLSTGLVPSSLKPASVTAILKKPGTDKFIQISNLLFVSKILEKAVSSQLHTRLSNNNNLYEQFQSGFHLLHRERLLKTTNGLLMAADSSFLTILWKDCPPCLVHLTSLSSI